MKGIKKQVSEGMQMGLPPRRILLPGRGDQNRYSGQLPHLQLFCFFVLSPSRRLNFDAVHWRLFVNICDMKSSVRLNSVARQMGPRSAPSWIHRNGCQALVALTKGTLHFVERQAKAPPRDWMRLPFVSHGDFILSFPPSPSLQT